MSGLPVGTTSVLDLIGNTALLALDRLHPGPGRLLAKAEFLQPGGSIKDRAAMAVIEGARVRGDLRPGGLVVEMTSGNMGAGLAVVCAALGHPLVLTISAGNSPARARMLEALGAEVVLIPQVDGIPGEVTGEDIAAATRVAVEIAASRGGFLVDQFHNLDGVRAHAEGTGPEIWTQTGGHLDAFVACVGSGGSFVGISRALKAYDTGILCVAVEPQGCEPLAGGPLTKSRHRLQGAGYGQVPPHWCPELMDAAMAVSDQEAEVWRRRLAHEEGLHVGWTAAANVAATARLLRSGQLGTAAWAVTLLCDTGLKY